MDWYEIGTCFCLAGLVWFPLGALVNSWMVDGELRACWKETQDAVERGRVLSMENRELTRKIQKLWRQQLHTRGESLPKSLSN